MLCLFAPKNEGVRMAPKHHLTPLSGGDRKALQKELGKARAMTNIFAAQSAEMRAKAESMLQQPDRMLCESWNERMWSDGEPIDPSPTIDQAVNGGFHGWRSGAPAARRRARWIWPNCRIRRRRLSRIWPAGSAAGNVRRSAGVPGRRFCNWGNDLAAPERM